MEMQPFKVSAGARAQRAWAPYVTVGDRALVLGDDVATAGRSGSEPLGPPEGVSAQDLHLVVQEGRLFQRRHPGVRVLLDRGRHLIVELTPREATELAASSGPDFAVRPVEPDMTVASVTPRAAAAPVPWVRALVDRIERGPFEDVLRRLTTFPTRLSTSPQYVEASAMVGDELTAMGYETRFEPISVGGVPGRNVIADRVGGGDAPRGLVYLVAHLDSVNHDGGPAAPAPGADDNGSGTAGVLEIARALRDHPAVHDLRLVLFGGEEQGLFGSRRHVHDLSAVDRGRIKAVINMDMIAGRNTPAPAVLIEGAAVSQAVIDALASAAGTYTALEVETSLFPFNSDHVPFIDAGLPAVLTIEGADGANDTIHGPGDVFASIDFDLALEILRMNVAALALTLARLE